MSLPSLPCGMFQGTICIVVVVKCKINTLIDLHFRVQHCRDKSLQFSRLLDCQLVYYNHTIYYQCFTLAACCIVESVPSLDFSAGMSSRMYSSLLLSVASSRDPFAAAKVNVTCQIIQSFQLLAQVYLGS